MLSKSLAAFRLRISARGQAAFSRRTATRFLSSSSTCSSSHRFCTTFPTRASSFGRFSSSACHRTYSTSPPLSTESNVETAPFPVFTSVAELRKWRAQAAREGKRVGFVPTMGALHEGHLSLVRASLEENDLTLVSIFVNPAQFAPTEDLSSYPRTLPTDMAALSSLQSSSSNTVSAIFSPTVSEMYPSPDGTPFTQHVAQQVGAFVEVQGLQHQMEGSSRPTFFRGVATVCTKLFHIVQPDLVYFGQKDIQQAIILRRLVLDLRFSYPNGPNSVRVLPTERDKGDSLALSSRNAYLTTNARPHATALYKGLKAGQEEWQRSQDFDGGERVRKTLNVAREVVQEIAVKAKKDNVFIELLYISLNDPISLEPLEEAVREGKKIEGGRGAILSGAAMIKEGQEGRATRLIDNVLLGFSM